MKNNSFVYLIGEGFRSVGKQKKMTSASIIIMCATMFIFGVFYLIGENINFIMKQVESQQGMRVIIAEDATSDQIASMETKIRQIDGVNQVTFYSKEDALASIKERLGGNLEILDEYETDNPFPDSYFVTLTDLELNNEVQEKIMQISGVDEITAQNDTISSLSTVAKGIQMATVVLLIILVVISVFIISYTIKLTVYARRREISIMKYVGATNGFIRGPFIVEGVIIGVISAIITLAVVGLAYNSAINGILSSPVIPIINMTLYGFSDIFLKLLIVYLVLGTGIGILGSAISMRKYLKV